MSKLPVPFGNPRTYPGHSGVDFPQPRGAIIRASGPGRVTARSRNTLGGFYIWVRYDNGPLVGYHHMDSHEGCPAIGSRVVEGTQLGFVGKLGLNSTGYHLHSEVDGHRTTAGYWRFFTPDRVVGQGDPAGGGDSKPFPTPPPSPSLDLSKEDDMKLLFITDSVDGNGVPGWALLNTRTGKLVTMRTTAANGQAQANGWARLWGAAVSVTRQDMLDGIHAIQTTS